MRKSEEKSRIRSIHFDGKQILELYRSDLTVENVPELYSPRGG